MEFVPVFLVCLFPLAVYALVLGYVNGRRRSVLVNGSWDFVGVLAALSGFVLVGGPTILAGVNERWEQVSMRRVASADPSQPLPGSEQAHFWNGLALAYFGGVIALAAYALWARRRLTQVYNVDPDQFQVVFRETVEGLGLRWTNDGRQWLLREAAKEGQVPDPGWEAAVGVTLELSPALRHVCLRWNVDDHPLRTRLETELGNARSGFRARNNPVGFWLLSFASFLLIADVLGAAAIIAVLIRGR